jgi:hypothetical protein
MVCLLACLKNRKTNEKKTLDMRSEFISYVHRLFQIYFILINIVT